MVLTLKNYAAALPPDLILQAKKNKVRECDETEKGRFVAYVDDGNESFDVSLTVRAGNEIAEHSCDCNSNSSFCRHKAALIIHIAKGGEIKEVVKIKKKASKVDELLADIDPNGLKYWVKGLINKNKDIEMSFVNYFSVKEQLTPAEFLKEIFLLQNDEKALAKVLATLFPYTFNFSDYLFISQRLPEDERKKWRTKMLTRSRNMSSPYKKDATEFCFKLADAEKSYRKMIDYIDSYTPYGIILQYFERMVMADKDKLLAALLSKADNYGWGLSYENKEKDAVCFSELFNLCKKYYTADFLKMAISNWEKGRRYFNCNNLIVHIKQQLSM